MMDSIESQSIPQKRSMGSPPPKLLPIMLIPGFMNSSLVVQESKSRPDWEGKKIWMDLPSLGFSPSYFDASHRKGKVQADPEQQQRCKSLWLEHMKLQPNLRNENSWVKIAPNVGVGALKNLTEGSFTNHQEYSFEPLIRALENAGYNNSTVNLEAAPYDWRLPPSYLELHHGYFSETIQMIEEMYQRNKGTPVILLGYSMGAKVAHYLLNSAKLLKGQAWVDTRIHTYIPVAAPHLGAPMALRSIIAGDMMGLDNVLDKEEALGLVRSYGSLPWLLPATLPPGVPSSVYVMTNGVLHVDFPFGVGPCNLINDRRAICKPNRLRLVMSCGQKGDPTSTVPLITSFNEISEEGICMFEDTLAFSSGPKARKKGNVFQIALHEPSLTETKEKGEEPSFVFSILNLVTLYFIFEAIAKLIHWLIYDPLPTVMTQGDSTTLALSEPVVLPTSVFKGKTASFKVALYHKDDFETRKTIDPRLAFLHVNVKWVPYKSKLISRNRCSSISEVTNHAPALELKSGRHRFKEISGHEMMQREGLKKYIENAKEIYNGDRELGPRSISSFDAPPVDRIHAIYGINVPTEIGGIYERKDACMEPGKVKNVYGLNTAATLSDSQYILKNGLLMETPKTKQVVAKNKRASGDGIVPYWSLHHVNTWKSPHREVTVIELEEVTHREILSSSRFHEELLTYCRREAQVIARTRKFVSASSTTCSSSTNKLSDPDETKLGNEQVFLA
jgi:pimeloyl-ACP methyl ester carboxylesterase